MIHATELTRTYGPLTAVDRLSFEVPKGAVCGFLGPNGAGKSTTIRMIAGLFPPDSGTLRVGGVDVRADPLAVRRQVGYLPETTPLYPELRLEEYLRFRARLIGLSGASLRLSVDRAIEACGLGEVRRRLIGALSRGFRQRTGLAAALIADPPLLVLDEPTVGLDPLQQGAFRTLLANLAGEQTVLLSSHLLAEVEASCTWLVMISGGRLLGSGPREALLAGEAARSVFAEVERARAENFQSILLQRSDVSEVRSEALDGGWTQLKITPKAAGDDLRAIVGGLAAEQGIGLRELRCQEQSLEAVFLELAKRAEADRELVSESQKP